MVTSDQIKNLNERIGKLKSYLDIDKKLIDISNEEEKASSPGFWDKPKEAEKLMKILREKKKWVTDYVQVKADGEDLSVLFDFYKEQEASEEDVIQQFEKTLKLSEKDTVLLFSPSMKT